MSEAIADADILVNGTSVGMAPKTEGCIITEDLFEDPALFNPGLIVSDVIYNPMETKLLQKAKAKGCPVFNGIYMLLYQGAESFRLWTGKEMPTETIKDLYFR